MTSDDAKDAIKRALADPGDVARRLSLDLRGAQRQAGGGLLVRCPSPGHGDRTASCSLTRGDDGTLRVRCFGCELAGDVFSLVAAVRGLDVARDFRTVLQEAAALVGVDVEDREHPAAAWRAPVAPAFAPVAPLPIGPGDRAFAALVAPLLHLGRLDGGPLSADVCAYLDRRGALDIARAEGWTALPPAGSDAARSWCKMLRDVAPSIAAALDLESVNAELAALIREDGAGFVHAAHRLALPYRAPCGTLYTWQRRRLDAGEPKYVFPRSREEDGSEAREGRGRSARWPYGVERLAAAPKDAPIVYCEGALDAAAVRAIDAEAERVRVVLGIPGTQAWKRGEGFFATFAAGRTAFVATDNDAPKDGKTPPGEAAAKRWGADAWRAGAVDVQRIKPPAPAKDWSDALAAALAERKAAP